MIGIPSLRFSGIDSGARLSALWPTEMHLQQLCEEDCLMSGEIYDVRWMLIQAPVTVPACESDGGDWAHHPEKRIELSNDLVTSMQLDCRADNEVCGATHYKKWTRRWITIYLAVIQGEMNGCLDLISTMNHHRLSWWDGAKQKKCRQHKSKIPLPSSQIHVETSASARSTCNCWAKSNSWCVESC